MTLNAGQTYRSPRSWNIYMVNIFYKYLLYFFFGQLFSYGSWHKCLLQAVVQQLQL